MKSNEKRFILVGLKIAYYRKLAGFTQEQLAEKVGLSAGYLSQVESRGMVQPVSLNTLFKIADACEVKPSKLLDFD